jgi:short-subunit dehydrogenase
MPTQETPVGDDAFVRRYGSWAVVAGASEGLGAAWGEALAARGLNLLLFARRPEVLDATAAAIRARHAVEVRTQALDLAGEGFGAELERLAGAHEVGFGVFNAAHAPRGEFLDLTLSDQLRSVDVNCRGPLTMAHVLGKRMAARGRGGLVLMSSLTAFQGSPFIAAYGATKAFNLVLGEGLWFELRARGIDVLACAAGATRTPGFLRASPQGEPGMIETAQVVDEALSGLGRAGVMIPGRFNRLASFLMRRVLPRGTAIGILGNRTRNLTVPS